MSSISRRDLFRSVFGRKAEVAAVSPQTDDLQTALILDRFCLAYQGSFCSVCVERCPVDGAMVVERGKPRVDPDFCTGCNICHEVCPAPKNAVFLVTRKPRQGMVARHVHPSAS